MWFFTKADAIGVHGIAMTPDGKIVLVMLSYAPGWRLPGGGRKKAEDDRTAMLRELREEIGLRHYDLIEPVTAFEHRPDHRRGIGTLFIIRGVTYHPRWSLEVKKVGEFRLDDLPVSTAKITRQLIAIAGSSL